MARVEDVARYIIDIFQIKAEHNLDDGMTNLRLQKVLYLVQGYHLALYGKPLFMDEIEAWKYGPVVPKIYATYSCFNDGCIRDNPPEAGALSETEAELVLDVLGKYGKYSTGYLVELTQLPGAPWAQVYNSRVRNRISQDAIEAYFKRQVNFDALSTEKRLASKTKPSKRGKSGHILLPVSMYEDWEKHAYGEINIIHASYICRVV